MDIILIVISVIALIFVVPKVLDKEDQQHQENEKENLEDIIDVDLPDYDDQTDFDPEVKDKILSPKEIFQLDDLEILARTLYGEGRNLPADELEKIAWVIRNRVRDNGRENFPDTYAEVCLQKYQFSCWNSLYHNQFKDNNQREVRRNVLSNQTAYSICQSIVRKVLNANEIENPLKNVQHYVLNTDKVKIEGKKIKESPYSDWVKNLEIVENEGKGSHIFLG